MMDYRDRASAALRKAALDEEAKAYVLSNPVLFQLLLKAARRYIGGESLEETLETRKGLLAQGFHTSVEFMGESVKTVEEAEEATNEFLRIIDCLQRDNRPDRVSLDLSHLGLFLDAELGRRNFRLLAEKTKGSQIDLIVSAEGTERTQTILDTYFSFAEEFPQVGITLQAYLHRTPQDVKRVLEGTNGKLRIVKGAYAGPEDQLLPRGPALDRRYVEIVEGLLDAGRFCSIATHDAAIVNQLKPILRQQRIGPSRYEFEMLYGIGNDFLNELMSQGHPCRHYIVYGREWFLYFCNRLAEHPENIFRALVDIAT